MRKVFSGSTAEPVIANIVANIVSTMIATASGRREEMLESWSLNQAVMPPTATGSDERTARSLCTSRSLAVLNGSPRGGMATTNVELPR